jgi:transcriptional regulator with XRE-family HTH domain
MRVGGSMRLKLKFAILSANTTQRKVSLASGIVETRLSAIIRGRATATAAERAALARALRRSEEDLFT